MNESNRELFNTNSNQSRPGREASFSQFELLARVASLYYLEDKTQSEIAKETGLSRQKIQRLLKEAREKHIVEIHVHAIPVHHLQLEVKLKEVFRLADVIVAPYHPDEQQSRIAVAQAAAGFLERHMKDESRVAVGFGRTISEIANFFRPARELNATFVSASGGFPQAGTRLNPNEICARFTSQSKGKAVPLYAPNFVANREVRDILLAQEAIKETINVAQHAEFAIVGIGAVNHNSLMVQTGSQTIEEINQLREVGAVGEILCNYYDLNGNRIRSDFDARVISLTMDELRVIPQVIAAVSEPEKDMALLGALHTGTINTLVTNCKLAISILQLAGVHDLEEEHEFFEDT